MSPCPADASLAIPGTWRKPTKWVYLKGIVVQQHMRNIQLKNKISHNFQWLADLEKLFSGE